MPMGNTLKLEDLLKPDCVPDESAGGENWRILHGDTWSKDSSRGSLMQL